MKIVQILKSFGVWCILFFVILMGCIPVIPSESAGLGLFACFFFPTIIASKFFPICDLYSIKWFVFSTVGRYLIDFFGFIALIVGIWSLWPNGDVNPLFGLISLSFPLIFPYIINCRRINTTIKYLFQTYPQWKAKIQQRNPDPYTRQYPGHPPINQNINYTMARIDRMEGHDFEEFSADLLRRNGYQQVGVTRGSGDQGVDIIAYKDGWKYAIQCKRYNQKLGNKPIQEVHTGKTIYQCDVAVVMTNSYFTSGAVQAASATGVLLWDRNTLQSMVQSAMQ